MRECVPYQQLWNEEDGETLANALVKDSEPQQPPLLATRLSPPVKDATSRVGAPSVAQKPPVMPQLPDCRANPPVCSAVFSPHTFSAAFSPKIKFFQILGGIVHQVEQEFRDVVGCVEHR